MAGSTFFVSPRELSPALRRVQLLSAVTTRMRRASALGQYRRGAWYQVIAEELTPAMTEGARAVHADARATVAKQKRDFYPTAEGQEELPVTSLSR